MDSIHFNENGSTEQVNLYPITYLKSIFDGYQALLDETTPPVQAWVCKKCKSEVAYIHSRHYSDYYDDSLYSKYDDSYWQCSHKLVFFDEVQTPTITRLDGSMSWADYIDKIYEEQGIDVEKENLDKFEQTKKTWNDPRYKKEESMKKYFNNQTDKKRSAGKKWIKEVEKPCKYALRAYSGEDVTVYKFKNNLTGKKDAHFYAECWQWECTGPITGKVYDLHICNCVHPGEKDAKGRLIWRDDWITDPKFVSLYDRLEDWYKWNYSVTDSKWTYDAERDNNPILNRKKGIVPSSSPDRESPTLITNNNPWNALRINSIDCPMHDSSIQNENDSWTTTKPKQRKF